MDSNMSTSTESSSEKDSASRSDTESFLKPIIGLTAEQLKLAQRSSFWKFWRIALIAIFWLLWATMVTGAILIIVLNNGDVTDTTTTAIPRSTKHQ
ncbi:hypothetical protein OESDEN_21331 [Oesophagostomum dentatum]|uniref:Solute carrier family 3 member 2 N-terminal domain-containing protein n=1 Tax=Oesophagostomum dentatum TaxID=61180 RepID=A0A0B1S6C0_OESDE|nr:hypothetical protein OESDEN_21331 [Oesophagostomum dentatum]